MKFKKVKGDDEIKRLTVSEKTGSKAALDFETRADGKPGLYVFMKGGSVSLTKSKAIKLAFAILDELEPTAW